MPLLLMATACARPDEEQIESGPVSLAADAVQILGTSPSIAVVRDLDVTGDGSVWLLNSVEPLFIGFRSGGVALPEHGTEGGGPEEYRFPLGFVERGYEDQSWVVDFGRHSLIRVSAPDSGWMEVPLPRDSLPPGSLMGGMDILSPSLRTGRLGSEIIVPRTTGSMDAGVVAFRMATLQADLMAFEPASGSTRLVVSLGEVLGDPLSGFVATDGGFPLWYRLWTVCGDGIRVYDRNRDEVRGFDLEGREVEAISLPESFREATATQFGKAVFALRQAEVTGAVGPRLSAEDSARVLREIVGGVQGSPRELAAYLPRYVDMRCSPDGTLWMHPLDLDAGGLKGGRRWLRMVPGQQWQGVDFPPAFDAYRFTADRIWGVQRDEVDVGSVAWMAIP